MERRLSAILAADIAGYSRMMRADEPGTLAALHSLREDVIDPELARHRGRLFKLMGDGMLIEFASVVDAVAFGADVQVQIAQRNRQSDAARQLLLRIGINLGDVMIVDDDIYGDGVNVAARLEALARPGGLCVSDAVYEQVRDRVELTFEDLGEQRVKNIDRPVRVWSWNATDDDSGSATPDRQASLALPNKPSIAVLPFDNMSGDPEQDYFADGMVEDIITELSRLKWLFVISRNSSFTYKGKAVDIKQVGSELGVRYVLEGSVRKAANRIRITGQLIDAATNAHLWADRFDGTMEDIFDLQDQVTQSVVGTIAPRLEQAEIERAKRKPTESLDAYDYYLRGMAAFHQFTRTANQDAVNLFTRAFTIDPGFAAAYGMAARCFIQRKGFGWVTDLALEKSQALKLARTAANLGRDDPIAMAAAGFTLVMYGEPVDGNAFLDEALKLSPNQAWTWHVSGISKALIGEPDTAISRATHAIRLSPQDPQLFAMHAVVALGHYLCGNPQEAFAWGKSALREKSSFLLAAATTAASAAMLGQQDEADKAMRTVFEANRDLRVSNLSDWLAFQRPQDIERWREGLRKAGLPE